MNDGFEVGSDQEIALYMADYLRHLPFNPIVGIFFVLVAYFGENFSELNGYSPILLMYLILISSVFGVVHAKRIHQVLLRNPELFVNVHNSVYPKKLWWDFLLSIRIWDHYLFLSILLLTVIFISPSLWKNFYIFIFSVGIYAIVEYIFWVKKIRPLIPNIKK